MRYEYSNKEKEEKDEQEEQEEENQVIEEEENQVKGEEEKKIVCPEKCPECYTESNKLNLCKKCKIIIHIKVI